VHAAQAISGRDLAARGRVSRPRAELVADRFLAVPGNEIIDLATGDEVTLKIETVSGRVNDAEQAAWALRCEWFFRRRHRALAPLIDYGALGRDARFEAWQCRDASKAPNGCGGDRAVVDSASAFLRANGLTTFGPSPVVYLCGQARVVIPDAGCGYEASAPAEPLHPPSLGVCGMRLIERQPVSRLAEAFAHSFGARSRAVSLWGPAGSGVTTAVRELARAARLQGFVPINAGGTRHAAPLVSGRTLFLIADSGSSRGWRVLLEWLMRSARPHVVLFAGPNEVPHLDGLPLDALPAEALANAVEPRCVDPVLVRRLTDASRRSGGLPGRFARLLWGDEDGHARTGFSKASEASGSYRVEPHGTSTLIAVPPAWPSSSELSALRRRLMDGMQLVENNRHAPGGRVLRQAIGALVRRNDLVHAARGELALAIAALARGRIDEALTWLASARDHATAAEGEPSLLLQAAVLCGQGRLEQGRLDEAESILHGAVIAARGQKVSAMMCDARIALARLLFWRGRFEEAYQAVTIAAEQLESIDQAARVAMSIRLSMMASYVAVGRGDFGVAIAQATHAIQAAEAAGDSRLMGQSTLAAAFSHLAVGDTMAVERDIARCLAAARTARDPLTALEARLLAAERVRRSGRDPRTVTPAGPLAHIRQLHLPRLPATIRARADLLGDLIAATAPTETVVLRHTAGTGLHALALFAPLRTIPASSTQRTIEDLLEVLHCCQNAADENKALSSICSRLRLQLGAASIAFVAHDGLVIASDGSRPDVQVARRVAAATQPIAPHLLNGSIEGGAPVQYAGEIQAVLIGRWTLGAPCDYAHAVKVMTLAATASAPAVAEVLARRAESLAQAPDGIVGLSQPIVEVRRAIERAAAAPFAVLILGESGAGKELVARSLHRRSPRRDRPFRTVNCAALADDLVESELFGHARGAFTGAVVERPGVFEDAHTGTLFLDEIGELSPRAQAKVLRTLQEGEIRRVGENISRRVDVRIVAATNRDLSRDAAAGRFRHDLLYRLDVVRIVVPPLRERRDDIAMLAERFWTEATMRVGSRAALARATLAVLARYDWPGNVRELQNVLAALAVRSPRRGLIGPTALPPLFGASESARSCRLDEARRTFEERFVRAALVRTGGHRAHAAAELGVTRQGLTKLMTRLGISD
jgi:DNA-binding NtrC family response regulator